MDINFYGQTEIFLDNCSAKFKYKIFHGHWPCNMDIGHATWTLATTHGQLSVANRCPWPIVHEIDKTQKSLDLLKYLKNNTTRNHKWNAQVFSRKTRISEVIRNVLMRVINDMMHAWNFKLWTHNYYIKRQAT